MAVIALVTGGCRSGKSVSQRRPRPELRGHPLTEQGGRSLGVASVPPHGDGDQANDNQREIESDGQEPDTTNIDADNERGGNGQ